jgi:hypothetical protein
MRPHPTPRPLTADPETSLNTPKPPLTNVVWTRPKPATKPETKTDRRLITTPCTHPHRGAAALVHLERDVGLDEVLHQERQLDRV